MTGPAGHQQPVQPAIISFQGIGVVGKNAVEPRIVRSPGAFEDRQRLLIIQNSFSKLASTRRVLTQVIAAQSGIEIPALDLRPLGQGELISPVGMFDIAELPQHVTEVRQGHQALHVAVRAVAEAHSMIEVERRLAGISPELKNLSQATVYGNEMRDRNVGSRRGSPETAISFHGHAVRAHHPRGKIEAVGVEVAVSPALRIVGIWLAVLAVMLRLYIQLPTKIKGRFLPQSGRLVEPGHDIEAVDELRRVAAVGPLRPFQQIEQSAL